MLHNTTGGGVFQQVRAQKSHNFGMVVLSDSDIQVLTGGSSRTSKSLRPSGGSEQQASQPEFVSQRKGDLEVVGERKSEQEEAGDEGETGWA